MDSSTAAATPRSTHPIFSIPGVTTRLVRGDGLHIKFTKGMYAHLLGSVLHYLCWHDGPGAHQAVEPCQRLALVFTHVQLHDREHQTATRLTNLKLSMFTKTKTPHAAYAFLTAKGAECKHLAPALLSVCRSILDLGNIVDQHIVAALEKVSQLVDLFDAASMFLKDEEYEAALRKAEDFLDSYDWLNKWALEHERKLFHVTIKFHTFWHLVVNSKCLNPRFHWCFKSEDFVGRISHITHSVSMSVRSTRLSLKVSPKYRIMLHLRLTREGFGLILEDSD